MIWMVLVLVLGWISVADAACSGSSPTLTAASAGYTDVNDCVTAAADGDTINVPSGTQSWASTLTITNKSISLVGAGIGSTVITCTTTNECLYWTTKATGNTPAGFTRLSGFTFKQSVDGCGQYDGITSSILFIGVSHNLRIDHNRLESTACGFIHLDGDVRGVVDHNEIDNGTSLAHPLIIEHDSWAGVGDHGDNSWAQASTIGSVDALYVEDNAFTNSSGANGIFQTDDWNGARTVYRFNTFTDSVWSSHGTESGGRPRGFRHVELYRNQFNWSRGAIESLGGLRGGTGMLFDNDVSTADPTQIFAFNTYRRDYNVTGQGIYGWGGCGAQITISSVTRSGSTATVTTSGEHFVHTSGSWLTIAGAEQAEYNGNFIATRTDSTHFTYTVSGTPATPATGTITKSSPFDGNTDSTGYPCLDQLGRGAGTYYSLYEPVNITPVSDSAQASEPVYCVNNKKAGTVSNCTAVSATDIIVNLRDYYNHNASFNGATQHGVGRGARASRPASCTTGDAWWSTDQGSWNTSTTETYSDTAGEDGVLDKCTATDTWTNAWYTPYTYPHPLADGGGGGGGGSSPGRFAPGLNIKRVDNGEMAMVAHE